jgi:hypothetical protein
MWFFNHNMRVVVFCHKREYDPRTTRTREMGNRSVAGGGPDQRRRYSFPPYEDLTRANLAKMRAIMADTVAGSRPAGL